MKVLLYEPGESGHRPVILRYTIKILNRNGISWVHESRPTKSARALLRRARESGCDLIYILTLDGLPWYSWRVSLLGQLDGISIVSTYYLYNNILQGWKAYIWRFIIWTGGIKRIFVSDEHLRTEPRRYPRQVAFLPDPWDPEEFPAHPAERARAELGIATTAVVFLMFGMIDERKGADHVLRATQTVEKSHHGRQTVFVFGGRMSEGVRMLARQFSKLTNYLFLDRKIAEEEISLLYHASDYIVCSYPREFQVSSNSLTRGFAAGLPAIASAHGVSGELIRSRRCGYLFEAGNTHALSAAINEALHCRVDYPEIYKEMSARARAIAGDRRLEVYGDLLVRNLRALQMEAGHSYI
jgi:glycosyltransferase involved in cell wall biosynthesis